MVVTPNCWFSHAMAHIGFIEKSVIIFFSFFVPFNNFFQFVQFILNFVFTFLIVFFLNNGFSLQILYYSFVLLWFSLMR